MKSYIVFLDGVEENKIPHYCIKETLNLYIKYKDDESLKENIELWRKSDFKTIVCKTNFKHAKNLLDLVNKKNTDNTRYYHSIRKDGKTLIGFILIPRKSWHKNFIKLKQWKPKWDEERIGNYIGAYPDSNLENQLITISKKSEAFDMLHFEKPEFANELFYNTHNHEYIDSDHIEKEFPYTNNIKTLIEYEELELDLIK